MMTREEAIALFEKQLTAAQVVLDSGFGSNPGENDFLYRGRKEMAEIALSALRPVSREQVEKVWRGEWNQDEHGRVVCNRCGSMAAIGTENALHNAKKYDRFCFYCGAPMTDEAVEMVMEKLKKVIE